jgi:MFS family permease
MTDQPFTKLITHKPFLYLWTSQILSQLTINLVTFSCLNQIYTSTKSTTAVSLLWLAFSLPIFLLGPLSGGLVDRFHLRRTMVITNLLQGLSVLGFLFLDRYIFVIYALVLLYSALDRFYIPAQQAAVPRIVEKDLLPTANGLFFLTQQTSLLIGFGLGGVLVSLIGQSWTIALSSLFLFLAALAAQALPFKPLKGGLAQSAGFKEFVSDLFESYRLVNEHPYLRTPFGLIILLQAYLTVAFVLLPSFANETLGISLQHATSLIIVPGAVGAFVVSFLLPKILEKHRKKSVISKSLLISALSLAALSLAGFVPLWLRIFIAILSAIGIGGSVAAAMIPANTLIQEQTPRDFGGRIYGLLGFLATAATILPLMAAASLADIFGARQILLLISFVLFAGYYYTHRHD